MLRLHTLFVFLSLFLFLFPGLGFSIPAEEANAAVSISDKDPLIIGNCQEIEYDLSAVQTENELLLQQVTELSESNKKLKKRNTEWQKSKPESSLSAIVAELDKKVAVTTNQLEHTSRKYNILIDEFEKRGEKIADLQGINAKQDDKTRFFWFGAGAVVFFMGLLAGKSGNRQKKNFSY